MNGGSIFTTNLISIAEVSNGTEQRGRANLKEGEHAATSLSVGDVEEVTATSELDEDELSSASESVEVDPRTWKNGRSFGIKKFAESFVYRRSCTLKFSVGTALLNSSLQRRQ
jgi:hypothetical protein